MPQTNYGYSPAVPLPVLGAPLIPQIPIQVLGPNGSPIAAYPPVQASESDRNKALMIGWDAYLLHVYATARYHPDALVMGLGWDALDEMLTSAAYNYPLRLVKYASIYKPHQILSPVKSKKQEGKGKWRRGDYDLGQELQDFCSHLVDDIRNPVTDNHQSFRSVLWAIQDAIHAGFSVNELVWRVYDSGDYKGKWGLRRVVPRRPQSIGFEMTPDTMEVVNLTVFTPLGGLQKRPIPLEKVLLYTYQPYAGLPWGQGNARTCYKHYWSIDQAMRWWGIAQKRFGSPFLEGITPDPRNVNKLVGTLAGVEMGATLAHTPEDVINVHWSPGGTMDSFEKFLGYHEVSMIKAFLGQTLTTTAGRSGNSYALGNVQQDTQDFFLSYPRHDLEEVVTNQLFRRAVRYNYGEDAVRLTPRLYLGDWTIAEMKLVSDFVNGLIDHEVLGPKASFIREMLNLPPDTGDEGRLTVNIPTPPPSRSAQ